MWHGITRPPGHFKQALPVGARAAWRDHQRRRDDCATGFQHDIARIIGAAGVGAATAFEQGGRNAVEPVVARFREPLEDALTEQWRSCGRRFGAAVLARLPEPRRREVIVAERKQAPMSVFERLLEEWIRTHQRVAFERLFATAIVEVIEGSILAAQRDGLSITDTAKLIRARAQGDVGENSAIRIARTETHASSIAGDDLALEATGLELERAWTNAGDDRVRDDDDKFKGANHVDVQGQRRKPGQDFDLGGGVFAVRPGDPGLPARHRINCRCIAQAVIPG